MKTTDKKAPKKAPKKVPAKKTTKTGPKKNEPKKKKNSLLEPTPAQVKVRNRMWAEALIENKRKARDGMYNKNGGRCCLAVAQDVAISCGLEIEDKDAGDGFPVSEVADFFGWGTTNPHLELPHGRTLCASEINDGDSDLDEKLPKGTKCDIQFGTKAYKKGLSHKEISLCVLNTFVRPSKKVWTH